MIILSSFRLLQLASACLFSSFFNAFFAKVRFTTHFSIFPVRVLFYFWVLHIWNFTDSHHSKVLFKKTTDYHRCHSALGLVDFRISEVMINIFQILLQVEGNLIRDEKNCKFHDIGWYKKISVDRKFDSISSIHTM